PGPLSLERTFQSRPIGTVRAVDRRGVPWGRRSPPWLKELRKLLVEQMVAALSRPRRCGLSTCAPPPRSLCAPRPCPDDVDRRAEQRLHQSMVIGESGGNAMMVHIEPGEHLVVARHKYLKVNWHLSLNCHRRFSPEPFDSF